MPRTKQPAPPHGWQFWRRAFWTRPAFLTCYGLALCACGLWLLDLAQRRRSATGSWWSARRGETEWALSPLMSIAILSGVPATLGFLALTTGLSPLWVAGITLGAAALAAVLLWRRAVRRRPAPA